MEERGTLVSWDMSGSRVGLIGSVARTARTKGTEHGQPSQAAAAEVSQPDLHQRQAEMEHMRRPCLGQSLVTPLCTHALGDKLLYL